jgi:hypothetical protein
MRKWVFFLTRGGHGFFFLRGDLFHCVLSLPYSYRINISHRNKEGEKQFFFGIDRVKTRVFQFVEEGLQLSHLIDSTVVLMEKLNETVSFSFFFHSESFFSSTFLLTRTYFISFIGPTASHIAFERRVYACGILIVGDGLSKRISRREETEATA